MNRVLILFAVIALVSIAAAWWRARDGRVQPTNTEGAVSDPRAEPGRLLLLELTAPACVPCEATRQILDTVAAQRPGVDVAAVDVGDALDFARRHAVLRAPTTLVLDAAGTARGRVTGIPREADLRALLDVLQAVPA